MRHSPSHCPLMMARALSSPSAASADPSKERACWERDQSHEVSDQNGQGVFAGEAAENRMQVEPTRRVAGLTDSVTPLAKTRCSEVGTCAALCREVAGR